MAKIQFWFDETDGRKTMESLTRDFPTDASARRYALQKGFTAATRRYCIPKG